MQNVVIIEVISTGRFYVKEVADRGLHPIVIYPKLDNDSDEYRPFREAGEAFARQYTNDIYYLETNDVEDAQKLVSRFSPIAIIAGSEVGVPLTDALSMRLGLPGNNPDTSLARRDKYLMTQALKKAGVPTIRSERVKNLDECLQTIRAWNQYPIVLKPLAGAGTQGVHFCSDENEVIEHFEEIKKALDFFGSQNQEVLVQEFARGAEFIVNTVSMKGRHTVTDLWEYSKIPIGSLGNAYNYAKLVRTFEPKHLEVIEYAKAALSALDFQYGPSHTEIMLTDRGPLLIETGARPMGGYFPMEVLDEALHHHIVDVSLDSYIDQERFQYFSHRGYTTFGSVMLKLFIAPREMKLKSLPILTLKKYVKSAGLSDFSHAEKQLSLPQTVNLITTAGELILTNKREADLLKDYHALRKMEIENFDLLFEEREIAIQPFKLWINEKEQTLPHVNTWIEVIDQLGQLSLQSHYGDTWAIETSDATFRQYLTLLISAFGVDCTFQS